MSVQSDTETIAESSTQAYEVIGWRKQFESHRSGLVKQAGYATLWPLIHAEARRWLSADTLRALQPAAVLRSCGFPLEARRRWALSGLNVRESVILVQGTGSGWDVLTWARLRPKRIIATDLFAFDSWDEISRYVDRRWNVPCEFRQAPLESHAFLQGGSIDVCGSDSVLEHCRDLDAVLAETKRVLKPGGRLYATYGPLWFTAGGDHLSGRGGDHTLFNHLVLSPAEYQAYAETHRHDVEDFQAGYRYIALDLFSRLRTPDYLRAFREGGFAVEALILEVSSAALRFRKLFPERYRRVLEATEGRCAPDDLILKTNLVRAVKADAA